MSMAVERMSTSVDDLVVGGGPSTHEDSTRPRHKCRRHYLPNHTELLFISRDGADKYVAQEGQHKRPAQPSRVCSSSRSRPYSYNIKAYIIVEVGRPSLDI